MLLKEENLTFFSACGSYTGVVNLLNINYSFCDTLIIFFNKQPSFTVKIPVFATFLLQFNFSF